MTTSLTMAFLPYDKEWELVNKELQSFDDAQKSLLRKKDSVRLNNAELFELYKKAAVSSEELLDIYREREKLIETQQRKLLKEAATHRINVRVFVEQLEAKERGKAYQVFATEWDLIEKELKSFDNAQTNLFREKDSVRLINDELFRLYKKAAGSSEELQSINNNSADLSYVEQRKLLKGAAMHRVNIRVFVEQLDAREEKRMAIEGD